MPEQVNIHAAKTHFSRLVERAEAGEQIVIARDGRPAARLVPLRPPVDLTSTEPSSRPSALRIRATAATYGSTATAPAPDAWLPAIVGRIVRRVDPVRVILFGSRAAGLARDDSDYDILVVLDAVADRRAERLRLRGALADLPIALDVVVAGRAELDPDWSEPRGIVQWAAEDGRVVYERG